MGNNLSSKKSDICVICENSINQLKNSLYLDIECSKCKTRSKNYYHSICFKNYRENKLNDEFICINCYNQIF